MSEGFLSGTEHYAVCAQSLWYRHFLIPTEVSFNSKSVVDSRVFFKAF